MNIMQTILIAIICLLLVGTVNAGSIHDAQYWDKNTFWGDWPHGGHTRTINDNDVDIDADTVNGIDVVGEIIDNAVSINKNKRKINKNRRAIKYTDDYISDNEADWSIDQMGDGGLGMSTVSRFVTGDPHYYTEMPYGYSVMQEIEETYPTKLELEETNNRLDMIEAWLTIGTNEGDEYDEKLARIRASRLNKVYIVGQFKCYPVGICTVGMGL